MRKGNINKYIYIYIQHEFSFYLTNTIDLRKVIIDGAASSFRTQILTYLKNIIFIIIRKIKSFDRSEWQSIKLANIFLFFCATV